MSNISLVIPTHNRQAELRRALISISKQTLAPHEIIIIDDASNPAVNQTIFSEVGMAGKGIVLRNERSRGANASRNIGVRAAVSDFVCFLDDDDEFAPEKIEVISRLISQNIADVIYHPATMIYDKEDIRYSSQPKHNIDFRTLLIGNAVGGTSMVCVKRQMFLEVGGFDENMPALQDYEAWLRCAKASHRFFKIDQPLTTYHHVTGGGSISKSLAKLEDALKMISQKYGDDIRKLSPADLRAREKTVVSMRVHRLLMQGENLNAASLAIRSGASLKDASLVLAGFCALLGLKTFLRLKLAIDKGRS